MNELIPEDLHHILTRIPRDVRSLLKSKPLVLAGGCIRAIIAGEKVSDFDLFGPTKDMLELAAKDLCISRKGRLYSTDNAFTVLSPDRSPIQFIHRWMYANPEQVISDFDFSIAQAAIWCEPDSISEDAERSTTGKWRSMCSPMFYPDLASKRLRYLAPARAEDAGGSILRARKFLARGYHIEATSFGKVIARLCMGVNEIADLVDDMDHTETAGVTGEAWLSQVLTAKLREVDPLRVVEGLELVDEHQVQDITPT